MDSRLNTILDNAYNIAIVTHTTPDGDALGSALALKHIIYNNYKNSEIIDIFADGEIGKLYEPMIEGENLNPVPLDEYDVAIVCDCPNPQRTGIYAEIISKCPNVINIDHHATNDDFGTISITNPLEILPDYYKSTTDNDISASSTCEIIMLMAQSLGLHIDTATAKLLYTGIITDTNNLTSNYSRITLQTVSQLLMHGFDAEEVKKHFFENSIAKTKLLGRAIQTIRFYNDGTLTTMRISYDTLTKLGANFEDTLGIIDNGSNITGTEVSTILIEKEPQQIYVSLRGKGKINVGEIASHFGGGGSLNLSAFQTEGNLADIEKSIVDYITHFIRINSVEHGDNEHSIN